MQNQLGYIYIPVLWIYTFAKQNRIAFSHVKIKNFHFCIVSPTYTIQNPVHTSPVNFKNNVGNKHT